MLTNGSMAMPMGPPMLPGYSLRVQLFAPSAYSATDTPIRSFRVVTSPEITLREFCQEASRVHTLNYGSPISIKKCQDDQLFDITQSDLLGPLFQNAATIRIIQATSVPSMRDSVPPTSALRYDFQPVAGRKRDRSASVEPNTSSKNTWGFNKRQRISDPNPDHPWPSREQDPEVMTVESQSADEILVPDSQQSGSVTLGNSDERHTQSQAFGSSLRAKSASYHISRPQERGRSVSTAATSPISAEQQLELPALNGTAPSGAKPLDTILHSGSKKSKSPVEHSVYDDIPSDNEGEGSATLQRTRAALKVKKSPKPGLSGLNRSKSIETPRSGSRRSSELPLTPESKIRKETGSSEVGSVNRSHIKAQKAAAAAAEERLRKAEEERLAVERERLAVAEQLAEKERQAEEDRKAEEERIIAEERIANEERKAEEARKAEEVRLVEERLAEKKRLAEEERNLEEARKAETERQAESLKSLREKTAQLSKKKSATPEHTSKEVESTLGQKRSTPVPSSSTAFIPKGRPTSAVKSALSTKSLSPELAKKSPEFERRGVGLEDQMPLSKHRRVSFREEPDVNVFPSQANQKSAAVSSPLNPKSTAPSSSQVSTSILPPVRKHKETPVPPPRRISTPRLRFSGPENPDRRSIVPVPSSQARATPKTKPSMTQERRKSASTPETQVRATSVPQVIIPSMPVDSGRRSTTPNLSGTKSQRASSSVRSSLERRTTPAPQRILPPPLLSTRTSLANKTTSKPERSSSTTSGNSKSAAIIPAKAKSASAQSAIQPAITPSPADDTADFELPASTQAILPSATLLSQAEVVHISESDEDDEDDDEDEDEDDITKSDEDQELDSDRSSLRESRSPVVFNQYPTNPPSTQKLSTIVGVEDDEMKSTDSDNASSVDDLENDDLTLVPAKKTDETIIPNELDDDLDSSTDTDSDSDTSEGKEVVQSRARSQAAPSNKVLLPTYRLNKHPRTYPPSSSSSLSTQEEVDHQLTSSMHQVTQSSPSPFVNTKTEIALPSSSIDMTVKTTPKPHEMKYGVSLSQLYSNKKPLEDGTSSTAHRTFKGSQSALRSLQEQSDDEISSEEDDDSSSDSSESSEVRRPSSRATAESAKKSRVVSGYTFARPP